MLRLEIEPVIRNAEEALKRIQLELPSHKGLPELARGVAHAARDAASVSKQLKRPFGIHRLPVIFLALALVLIVYWLYQHFYAGATLKIALPDRDAQELRNKVSREHRLQFVVERVPGSREAAALVAEGRVDLAFVQGGVPIAPDLPRLETPHPEVVLWFVRSSIADVGELKRVLTSLSGEGSHSAAQAFFKSWKIDSQIEYAHEWKRLSSDEEHYAVPDDVDAVFVVKDPADEQTLRAAARLMAGGFRLESPNLGARAEQLEYLRPRTIPVGYLLSQPPFPSQSVATYSVATYLVARRDLTPRLLSVASHLIEGQPPSLTASSFDATVDETSEIFQGVDAFLGILINIVLAFLALLGWEMMAYRRRFHELNSLISLLSIHQSSKDVLGLTDAQLKRNNLLYLSLCSDLLGLISTISGYYTQENSSLLFNNLPEIIHSRCDGLKINIQLKILHAMIDIRPLDPTLIPAVPPTGTATSAESSSISKPA
jgi:hypothetical protein